jgi:hypothetical protein
MKRFLSFMHACWYTAMHPFDAFNVTVVRRYADAQGNYIGELYEGNGASARMIGASCDNWPLDADVRPLPMHPRVCWQRSFLDPLPKNTLRVGAMEPVDNADVQAYVAARRFLPLKITVLNRFVEHILRNPILKGEKP